MRNSGLYLKALLLLGTFLVGILFAKSSTEEDFGQVNIALGQPPQFENSGPENVVKTLYEHLNKEAVLAARKPTKDGGSYKTGITILTTEAWKRRASSLAKGSGMKAPEANALHPTVKILNESISAFFLSNDFVLDKAKSSQSEKDDGFYDYQLAFEREETACILTVSNEVKYNLDGIPQIFVDVSCSKSSRE